MARTRMIKPEFWSDEKLAKLSLQARLTYIGLWNLSDDYGVVKGHPAWLKNSIYPYDDLRIGQFETWLAELERIGRIVPFVADGEKFYCIKNFQRHQTINRPSQIRNPEPPASLIEDSMNAHGSLTKELCFYYERKEPREQALDLWFTEVKHIPDEPLDWMRTQITSRHEFYPKNLPVVMRELWQQWLMDHPNKRAKRDEDTNCKDCEGTGILTLYQGHGGRCVFRCGRCRQSNLNGIPVAFVNNLLAQGYTLINPLRRNRSAYG